MHRFLRFGQGRPDQRPWPSARRHDMSRHMERTTIRLPGELLTRARRRAAEEGRTLTSLLEEGLRRVVSEPTTTIDRVMPPVSSAHGGFAPGVQDVRLSMLQEIDDLAYLAGPTRVE